ncbi:MAG: DUF4243 domain-containing protein [Mycobacteriaceae bacterium]|nr:DUF4243 domain-containing protein [Mycobacteriaceae bacterium]
MSGSTTYAEAVNGALDRLQTTGFYLDRFFANHGPMAAEALATLGYCDEVDGWVDDNIRHRSYPPLPTPWQSINDDEGWRQALGDRRRGGDWIELFRRELSDNAWRSVLETWWPRLLPGCAASLTHGLIRTAHAVRSLGAVERPSDLQIDELARGLAFWATGYSATTAEANRPVDDLTSTDVGRALSELTAEYAGHYAATAPSQPVPLIHTITAPAAMRLALSELPAGLHAISLHTIGHVNRQIFAAFGGRRSVSATSSEADTGADFTTLAAQALDIGDEHAIKLCEAAAREHALAPDGRYLRATSTALRLLRR